MSRRVGYFAHPGAGTEVTLVKWWAARLSTIPPPFPYTIPLRKQGLNDARDRALAAGQGRFFSVKQ